MPCYLHQKISQKPCHPFSLLLLLHDIHSSDLQAKENKSVAQVLMMNMFFIFLTVINIFSVKITH